MTSAELIHKRECPWCSGKKIIQIYKDGKYIWVDCGWCDGTGEVIVNTEHPS